MNVGPCFVESLPQHAFAPCSSDTPLCKQVAPTQAEGCMHMHVTFSKIGRAGLGRGNNASYL